MNLFKPQQTLNCNVVLYCYIVSNRHSPVINRYRESLLKTLVVSSCLMLALFPTLAHATTVYPGCAAPSLSSSHHTFYVDPVKGSKSGDGSAAKPWRTLAEVLDPTNKLVSTKSHNQRTWSKGDYASFVDVNPTGPIKAGDVIMLRSGNHGSVTIFSQYNTGFITIMAAPGQTPVVNQLKVVSSGKWMFQGIKFQSPRPTGFTGPDGIVDVGYGDWLGNSSDIVFDNDSFSATDDTSSWTASQWMSVPYNYAAYLNQTASCVAITNSHVYNVINGIQAAASQSVIQGNVIEYMSNDGIDMMASNLIIKANVIKNGVNDATTSELHADGIQGWSLLKSGKQIENKNVLVDSNTIIKTGSASKTYLQGISIFDGQWNGLTISNNVVVSNDYQGIALYGGTNSSIVNNTVIASDPSGHGTWIMATKAKGGGSASNVVVRNNITPVLQIQSPGVTADHNIVGSNITMLVNGVIGRLSSGSIGSGNTVVPTITNQFVSVNNTTGTYDLRPKATSPALGFGVASGAPAIDILGKTRRPSVTAGAYN